MEVRWQQKGEAKMQRDVIIVLFIHLFPSSFFLLSCNKLVLQQ